VTLKREKRNRLIFVPDHPMAKELIMQNLLDKYKAFTGNDFPEKDFAFDFKLTNQLVRRCNHQKPTRRRKAKFVLSVAIFSCWDPLSS
jgi:CRISPR/Cas system endoribonuclease Cas6 (RAMP superfamily)